MVEQPLWALSELGCSASGGVRGGIIYLTPFTVPEPPPCSALWNLRVQLHLAQVRQPKIAGLLSCLFYLPEICLLPPGLALCRLSGCQGKQTFLPRSQLSTCCCLNSIKIRGSVGRDTAALLLMQCQAGWELSIKSN